MKEKALLLVLLLVVMPPIAVNLSIANGWEGFTEEFPGYLDLPHIVISNNGTITPSGMPIAEVNGVYRFTGDISNYSLYVEKSDILIDGAGFTLLGNRLITSKGVVDAHGIFLQAVNNVTIENLNITTFNEGVWNLGSTNIKITSNQISGCDQGITFVSNNIYNGTGFTFGTAMNNTIQNNIIFNNGNGINILGASYGNKIEHNHIINNIADGIYFQYGNNTIAFNDISKNSVGFFIDAGTQYNVFIENNLTLNGQAIVLNAAKNNLFYKNALIDNNQSVGLPNYGTGNIWANLWDNGSMGNFWDDYKSRYPNASEIGVSGIENTPYVISANNIDHYPLTQQVNTSASVPEFSWLTILLILLTVPIAVAIVRKRMQRKVLL